MAKKKMEKETGRPSVYLLNKCDSLEKVLDFFLATEGTYCRTLAEKRAVFLAQIDFWDWEIENLIFSFDSFMERVKAWNSTGSLCEYLGKQGFQIRNNLLRDLEYKRWRRNYPIRSRINKKGEIEYVKQKDHEVIAPVDNLNKVIGKWNDLLAICEEDVLAPKKLLEAAIHLGAQVEQNLKKYRKKEKAKDECVETTGGEEIS